jgi:hypothetical protein
MKMWFGDNTSKNYTFHIVVVIFLSGNLKITYGALSKSNAPYFLSPYILVVLEKPLHQWSPWAFSIMWVETGCLTDDSTTVDFEMAEFYMQFKQWPLIEFFVPEHE